MSIHCNPKIISKNLLVYLDAANQKSFPKYGLDKWGDISDQGNHFFMWGNLSNINDSFLFTGNTTNYFSSDRFDNHPTTELSVEMWILPNVNSTGDAFYSFISENSTDINHYISDQSNLTISGPNYTVTTGKSIIDGSWKHLIRTSIRNTGIEKLYINGTLEFEEVLSPSINFNQNGVILLGEKPNVSGILDSNYAYSGNIAIFKLYNKALNEDEVKQNFNALKGRFLP